MLGSLESAAFAVVGRCMRPGLSVLVPLLLSGAIRGQSVQLSGPLTQPATGDLANYIATSDGSVVIYLADQEVDERVDLYSVPGDGSAPPVRLSAPEHGDVGYALTLDPAEEHLVYLTLQGRLFAVPVDGSAPPQELASGITGNPWDVEVRITADGERVVHTHGVERLVSVPIDASAAPIDLGPPGAFGVGVDFMLAADRAVFRAKLAEEAPVELYVTRVDGSTSPSRLHVPFPNPAQEVERFDVSPDGTRVVYMADQDTLGVTEIYAVPVDGSASPIKLSGTSAPGWRASLQRGSCITPDSGRVVYLSYAPTAAANELFSVAIDGSAEPVPLTSFSGLRTVDGTGYQLSSTSRHVVFETRDLDPYAYHLWSARLSGDAPPVRLTPELDAGGQTSSFQVAPDGERVVFGMWRHGAGGARHELYSALIDGGGSRRDEAPATPPLVRLHHSGFDFEISSDAETVVTTVVGGLWSMPIDGSGAGVLLEYPPGTRHGGGFRITPNGEQVLFTATPQYLYGRELYTVPIHGGALTNLSGPLALGPVVGEIVEFQVSPDGVWTVYLADAEEDDRFELFAAPSDGSLPAVRINNPFTHGDVGGFFSGELPPPGSFLIMPDSSRVVYIADPGDSETELFVGPIDGSAPALQLTQLGGNGASGVFPGLAVSPDGTMVVFSASTRESGETIRGLYSAPLDGSAQPVRISGALCYQCSVPMFEITPDGESVVYTADEDFYRRYELHSVPLDGSAPAIELESTFTNSWVVEKFQLDSTGTRAVYLFGANGGTGPAGELYSTTVDGSSAPVHLNESSATYYDWVREFRLTPDGSRVVYVSDPLLYNKQELFSVPTDGSSAPVRLNSEIVPLGEVVESPHGFHVSPDGTRVVYLADQDVNDRFELYSVPVDASAAPIRLNPALPADGDVSSHFVFSPDGSLVAYVADQDTNGVAELYSVPVAGGPAVKLNGAIAPGGGSQNVLSEPLVFTADGARVVYTLDQKTAGVTELFLAAADGGGTPHRLNGPLQTESFAALEFRVLPDASRVVYLAPQAIEDVPELFSVPLARPERRARADAPSRSVER